MNNRKISLCAIAWFCGLIGLSYGQDFLAGQVDETAAAPQPPFLQKPTAIAYTATFNHKQPWPKAETPEDKDKLEAAKKNAPRIKAVQVDLIGDLRHDVRLWNEDGALQTEAWYSQSAAFKKALDSDGNLRGIYSEPAFRDHPDPFPELAWVSKDTFAGAIRQGEKKVIDVYRMAVEGPVGGFDPILYNNEEITAYVDDATKLPLALKTSKYTLIYTYRNPPVTLSAPPEYVKAFQEYRQTKARVYRVP